MSNPHPEAKEVQFSINLTENALIHTFMMEVRAYLKGAKQKSEKICLAFYLHAQETLSLEHSKLIRKTLPKAQRTRGLSSVYQINLF